MRAEIRGYPVPVRASPARASAGAPLVALPLVLETPAGRLGLFTATTVFGSVVDVTAEEMMIGCFHPTSDANRELLEASGEN